MTTAAIDSPDFLPFKLDLVGRRVLWLRLDEAQRREAAFLDGRAVERDGDASGQAARVRTTPCAALPRKRQNACPDGGAGRSVSRCRAHGGHCDLATLPP